MMVTKNFRWTALLALAALVTATVWTSTLVADPPDRTSSFFGTVTLDGESVAVGTEISASVGGVELDTSTVFESPEGSAYRVDVPTDLVGTPAVEGGSDGQEVRLLIAGAPAPQVGTFVGGQFQRLDLTATAGSDLSVTKTSGVSTVEPGATLTYRLTVTNAGPFDVTGVTLEDPLPVGTSFVSASDGGALAGTLVRWPAFDLTDGASVERTVTVQVATVFPAPTTEIRNVAMVFSDGADGIDPAGENNSGVDAVTLLGGPDLRLSKDADISQAGPGRVVTYTLTLTNTGFQDALGVELSDTLPAVVTFLTASDDGREVGGVITWPAFDLALGETVTRTVRAKIFDVVGGDVTEVVNSAVATATVTDVNPADNSASHVLPILQVTDLVATVGASSATVDPQTLAVGGIVDVELSNPGNGGVAEPFDVAVFEDLDGDGRFDAALDNVLGQATFDGGLDAGATAPFSVPVAGTITFRNQRLYAIIDADNIIPETDESNNVVHTAEGCLAVPVPEAFEPVVELEWPAADTSLQWPDSDETLSTPIVVDLNRNGTPDIVFVTDNRDSATAIFPVLRAIDGRTGRSILTAVAPVSEFTNFAPTGLAAGDIDNDGQLEIVVSGLVLGGSPPNVLIAYERNGSRKWTRGYRTHPSGSVTNRDNPSIADLDGDGVAEVIVGANVFRGTNGQVIWSAPTSSGQGFQSAGNRNGLDSGAISVVADLDHDGQQEVVTGNTAYRADGSVYWQVAMDDGYPAVANFDVGDPDGDETPEIVVVSKGQVRLHDHDGTLIWGPVDLPGVGDEAGGPPTVADFDADGEPEIGVAGSTQYAVFETDGTVMWQRATQDGSSNMTGSTVFDLDGDGRFEVIYRDETHLRIYRGSDGTVLFEDAVSSETFNEQPVVADVDGDGRAEIIVSTDRGLATSPPIAAPRRTAGLRIYGDANDNWIGARGIWNQHAYHIDNVNADGTIPAQPERGWLTHNTFRANVPVEVDAFAAPDLSASFLRVDLGAYPNRTFTVRVGNGGLVSARAGVPVAFYDGDPAVDGQLLGVVNTPQALDPGEFVDLDFTVTREGFGPATVYAVAADDGQGGGRLRECDTANNRVGLTYDTDTLGLLVGLDSGGDAVQPGAPVTYTVTVANGSSFERTGIVVADTLPPYTTVESASDGAVVTGGGNGSGGVVSWPPFTLAPGETATRTLTLRVDAAIPLSVMTLTNMAEAADDGSHGADPSPANNRAVDTDQVLTVLADAGGPYAADEGVDITFDASGSSDRDGTVAAFAWDLDGDGQFDDGTGAVVTGSFPDEGTYTVTVRVTDDSGEVDTDSAEVTVTNAVPVFGNFTPPSATEGDSVILVIPFTDTGLGDTHTATLDWGDGTVEAGLVESTGPGAHVVRGGHGYPDDGLFTLQACATDNDGATACLDFQITVTNDVPVVVEDGRVDLSAWRAENQDPDVPGRWNVAADGQSVLQELNGWPTAFYGPFVATNVTMEGQIRVQTTGDDDQVGFLLGYKPGDFENPNADYLMVDWRQSHQTISNVCPSSVSGARGLAVSRVSGMPTVGEFWAHRDFDDAECGSVGGITELARGLTRGSTGWADHRTYTFRFETTPTTLKVWVDGTLEFDLTGDFDFGSGRLAFFNSSQEQVRYSTFTATGLGALEGEDVTLRALFSEVGVLDTHTATVDWGDGTTGPGTVVGQDGTGTVQATHTYLDDGFYGVEICVEDDDGGVGCGVLPAAVANLPPTVDAGGRQVGYTDRGIDLVASFVDPGVLDTHTATVDWGDGSPEEPLTVNESGGAGTATGQHVYAEAGDYTATVCVIDDDGDGACDTVDVLYIDPVLDLSVELLPSVHAVRPGQSMEYALRVANRGTLPGTDVTVTLDLPSQLTVTEPGAAGVNGQRVTWTLPSLAYEEWQYLRVGVQAAASLPFGQDVTATATVTDDGREGPDANPADNTDSASLLLWDAETPIIESGFNLGRNDRVTISTNSEQSTQPAAHAVDGEIGSMWQIQCGDAVNRGGSPYLELGLPEDASVYGIAYFAQRRFSSNDFLSGRFDLFDAQDQLLYSTGEVQLVPPRDLVIDLPNTPGVRRVRFTAVTDRTCNPGLGELVVVGAYGDNRRVRVNEGEDLVAASLIFDDAASTYVGSVDWGDGTVDPGTLEVLGDRALLQAEHAYADNGVFAAESCVTDGGGNTGCTPLEVTVDNVAPRVDDSGTVDLRLWQVEDLLSVVQAPSEWRVTADGTGVRQVNNPNPAVFYGDFPAVGRVIEGSVRVEDNGDNDHFGFVLGFEPGDSTDPNAEYILVDWRKERQTIDNAPCSVPVTGVPGLVASRIYGIPDELELWGKVDLDCNGPDNRVEVLARANTLGNTGWARYTDYDFRIEYSTDRLRVFVNGGLQLDLVGDFPEGQMAFYNHSQRGVVYSALRQPAWVIDEGNPLDFEAKFTDPGEDTHTGTVAWGDGAVSTVSTGVSTADGTIVPGVASDTLFAQHIYGDNLPGTEPYAAEVCVTDDDGGTDCGFFDILVRNLPPSIEVGADRQAGFGAPFVLDPAPYVDPGFFDTHTATVDWGDGTVTAATVSPDTVVPGMPVSGTVTGGHTYAAIGTYTVEVCVTDDDGESGCDSFVLEVTAASSPMDIDVTTAPSLEGEIVTVGVTFTDADGGDTHTAVVDWGDGSAPETVAVTQTASGGSVDASHRYLDEGAYPVEVCITDSVGVEACGQATQPVDNLAPEPGRLDLRRFTLDEAPGSTANDWRINDGGHRMRQLNNGRPNFLYGDFSAVGSRVDGVVRLERGDDDYVGWVMGYQPGDVANPDADYLMAVWKRTNQTRSSRGLRLYRMRGAPSNFFEIDAAPQAELLAEGATLGDTGWGDGRDYPFTVEMTADRYRLWINGALEIDVTAPANDPFDDGRFGIYTAFQQISIFRDLVASAADIDDTSPFPTPRWNFLDLSDWTAEDRGESSNWTLSTGRIAADQSRNGISFFVHPEPMAWRTVGGMVRPMGDDDWIGMAVGYEPGDIADPEADYILAVWKRTTQREAPLGFKVFRIQGVPSNAFELTKVPESTLLATGTHLGGIGWSTNANYDFRISLAPDRLRVWVNDRLEADVSGDFRNVGAGDARWAVYSGGQQGVRYRDLYVEGEAYFEGDTAPPQAQGFIDPGILDTHTATVAWGDGSPAEDASVIQGAGVGTVVTGGHLLIDDVLTDGELCVTDNVTAFGGGAASCIGLPLRALNRPPVVDAGDDGAATTVAPFDLRAPFTDPGIADTHTATVDWGDGVVDIATVEQGSGTGAVLGQHTFTDEGLYTVEVCVTDDDGGVGCDTLLVEVTALPPGTTTVCEGVDFDDPEWTLSTLGDAGQASVELIEDRLHLRGTGTTLYHSGDNAVFYHREMPGDEDFRVEVDVTDFPVDTGGAVRKAALMLRSGLGERDPRVMVTYVPHMPGSSPDDPTTTALQFDFRTLQGEGGTEMGNTVFDVPMPSRLAIEKRGKVYTVYYSVDGGATWIRPADATYGGSVELELGGTVLAGVAVASYDASIPLTAELDDFGVCRPNVDPPLDPPPPPACDPEQPLDVLVLLDVSGSMTAPFPGSDPNAPTTRLEAAQASLGELAQTLVERADGSRMALLTFAGFRTPEENLAGAYEVLSTFDANVLGVDTLLQAIDPSTIDTGTTTPAALALGGALDTLLADHDPTHQTVVVWVTDGIPNVDGEGRGPTAIDANGDGFFDDAYELEELQAISLRGLDGRFLSWGEVAWLGDFNGDIGTFDGEPLADAMFALEQIEASLPHTLTYGVAVQGDGMGLGTFNEDLLEYAAYVSGGLAFSASDSVALSGALAALGRDLACGGTGTSEIAGRLWLDADGDGLEDAGEAPLAHVAIDLFDGSGVGFTSAFTGVDGGYAFVGLPAGTYSVRVDVATLPSTVDGPTHDADGVDTAHVATVAVGEGERLDGVSFGYGPTPPDPDASLCAEDPFDAPVLDGAWAVSQLGDADQGAVALVGGALELTSDGTSLYRADDNGTFVHRTLDGDFRVETRIEGFPVDAGGPVRKACLTVRAGVGVRDARVMACSIPHLPEDPSIPALQFEVRHGDGVAEALATLIQHVPLPVELAIERNGDRLAVEYRRDGGAWTQPTGQLGGAVDLVVGETPEVGLMVASYDASVTTTAAFEGFRVCR